ncbi:MAG: CBS domain-containing protein [Acidobacteriota bacterium]|nr:CBS domain-containing protein [Acidobacteriota bacterium]
MKSVSQLLEEKDYDVWSVSPESSIFDGLKLMAEKNIGALLVVDSGNLIGIFSERDYARKIALKGKTSHETSVREIMTKKVASVRPDQSIQECMELMTEKHIRHLPVLENEQLVGVISIGDVVKAVISEQAFIIEQLENYIAGSR